VTLGFIALRMMEIVAESFASIIGINKEGELLEAFAVFFVMHNGNSASDSLRGIFTAVLEVTESITAVFLARFASSFLG
jgi:hypothetical protein